MRAKYSSVPFSLSLEYLSGKDLHTYIKLYLNSNFRVAKHANIFELTQNKNYIENIYIYTLNARKEKYHLQFTILSLSMSGKKNLHEGNILYFSLKVCKKKLVRKKSGSAFHCLAEK